MRISDILQTTAHRPWEISGKPWRYYQEWNNAVFLHWKVPAEIIRPLIPGTLELDMWQGGAWVSLVAFTMEKLRVNLLPSVPGISDFHEVNLRTYVVRDGKPGVYFLSMEGEKQISVSIAKNISGLPYIKSSIKRNRSVNANTYNSSNPGQGFELESTYSPVDEVYERTALDKWLVERYCLYYDRRKRLYRYDIHHLEWDIKRVELKHLKLHYRIGDLLLSEKELDLLHFSSGVKVLAWPRQVVA